MMHMRYRDVTIEATGQSVIEGGKALGRYRLRVLQSPAGEMKPEEAIAVEFDEKALLRSLAKLEARELSRDDMVALGRTLATLLLPVAPEAAQPSVRELFARSLAIGGQDEGVRLRLRLPRELSVIPWEYVFVERAGGEGMDGFLALDPRVAIVRHEEMAAPVASPRLEGDIKVVAALAGADDLPELDLDVERDVLTEALRGVDGVTVEPFEHARLDALGPRLTGAGVFHFAGHGDFTRQMGARPGTYVGSGFLAFEDARVPADQLAINLRGNGVRLAVLAGCKTARRDGISVWSGIAPALVKAEIPAVLANQYSITDKCAIAFSRAFYQSLAGGQPLERAVTAGRVAAFNADQNGRDWGVPVLYLRAGSGELFGGAADRRVRETARETAEAAVRVRAAEVGARGVLHGAEVKEMVSGKLSVDVVVDGAVFGELHGLRVDRLGGGSSTTTVQTGNVGPGGTVIGAKIGTIGGASPAAPRAQRRRPPPAAPQPTRSSPRGSPPRAARAGASPPEAAEAPAPAPAARSVTKVSVTTGEVNGGTVIGQQDLNQISAATVNIYQGGAGPAAAPGRTQETVVEERIRLDVAVPKTAEVNRAFKVFVAVKQPGAPKLTATELDQVVSQEGMLFREDSHQVVRYRVEVTGDGFTVTPPQYVFRLRPKQDSPVIGFQVIAAKSGRHSLFVNAYQEDSAAPELIAQTILEIEVEIAVKPT